MKRYPAGILASCSIPWTERFEFMEDIFRAQVRLILAETQLIYIMGTSGEGYAVSDSQFKTIVGAFSDEVRSGGGEPMVGLIHLSSASVQARIDMCRDMGVRDFQISLPGWGAVNDKELFAFFHLICDANPDCRFLHYNIPRTKRIVTSREYVELETRHENLVATKHGTDSMLQIAGIMSETKEIRHFITDFGYLYGATLGECGLLIAIASCNFALGRRYFELARDGDYYGALELHKQLVGIRNELTKLVLPTSHMDGAFDKMYIKLQIPEFPLRLYPPYEGSSDETFHRFVEVLKTNFPEWHPAALQNAETY